ncbi:MAG TPA: alpha/beta fold hydrolase [Opitutaceae bacterium]|jgi:pimeloyl-ACP methyl ester carboxylesterase|nr:alpha/beta fold hydrolase [Opitutaceae bacterium]
MKTPHAFLAHAVVPLLLLCCAARGAETETKPLRELVQRLKALDSKADAFGAAYQPILRAALPWYETWGHRVPGPVDEGMMTPDDYAAALAGALESGHNYFADNPASLFPLVFRKTMPDGRTFNANYWLSLPEGFPKAGQIFPLVIDLHGSGWLGHKISLRPVSGPAGPTFSVTPIDMEGPWQIDFLNAYLDELLTMLPIDRDRIYVQGHSLGGMATWEWAMDNPERFAAISPRAGIGEPYRASRLKNIPVWAIHGENDDVIPYGLEETMVSAVLAQGGSARLAVLKGVPHNMPADLDQGQVIEWYLRQTRSHLAVPADPRDTLGIDASGFSHWEVISVPDALAWKSQPVAGMASENLRGAAKGLLQRAHDHGQAVDSQLMWEIAPDTKSSVLWLPVPKVLHAASPDVSAILIPGARYVRYYGKGRIQGALDHLQAIRKDLAASGRTTTGSLWYTPLSLWQDTPGGIYECRVRTN